MRCPASISGLIASAACSLEMAISSIESGGRPAIPADRAIAARTSASRCDGVASIAGMAARPLIRTAPAHNAADMTAGARADLVLLSPIFPTQSHPDAATLGPIRFGLMARRARTRVVGLGGMDARRFRNLRPLGAYGWA